jgi:hypothetical protein
MILKTAKDYYARVSLATSMKAGLHEKKDPATDDCNLV